ncbi:8-amino-7-oxononanoate synthase, partial [Dissostichus eleginoides]
ECGVARVGLSDKLGNPHRFIDNTSTSDSPTSPGATRQAVQNRNPTPGRGSGNLSNPEDANLNKPRSTQINVLRGYRWAPRYTPRLGFERRRPSIYSPSKPPSQISA